ncbi:MAG TPA: enoyl-CoA hydratase [Stellaceae bacterium]|jgi:enoyl-CoA hydratase/carnithine racemase
MDTHAPAAAATNAEPPPVLLRLDDRGGGGIVAYVTVDNPRKLNTLNSRTMAALAETFDRLAADEKRLRAVVLSGAGDRAFIGGADIGEMAAIEEPGAARAFITLIHRTCDAMRRMPAPVIARIQGYALGAGMEVAAACDLRIAAAGARFGMPEVRLGIPSVVEAALLPMLIGWGRTRDLLLCGETIDAAEAARIGFVEEVAPTAAALDEAVERRVAAIVASGPRAIRAQKALIRAWEDLPVDQAVQRGIDAFAASWESDEPKRMMAEFLAARRQRRRADRG